MIELSFHITSPNPYLSGWSSLWAKRVAAFYPKVHCIESLVGARERLIGHKMAVNVDVPLPGYMPGELLYICGVSYPYRWANNLHLPVQVTGNPEDSAIMPAYTGDIMTVTGATYVEFDDAAAMADYAHLGRAFTTCRNFQFGATMKVRGLIPFGEPDVPAAVRYARFRRGKSATARKGGGIVNRD